MRIVIDLQSLQTVSRNRGIGRYSLSLAQAMVLQGSEHEFIIALNHAFPDTIDDVRRAFADLLPAKSIVLFRTPTPVVGFSPKSQWNYQVAELMREQFLQQLRPDCVHVSSLFEGLVDNGVTSIKRFASLPTAVTLYDLIPYINSEHYFKSPDSKSWYMRKLTDLQSAELLLAISEHSRQETIETLGLPADRVINISTDADAQFRVLEPDQQTVRTLRSRYDLTQDFIMYTGGDDYRKNIDGLIRAYAFLPPEVRSNHQLAIVCQVEDEGRCRLLKLASQLGLAKDELVVTGYVSDEDLVLLYNLCKLFVFPSLHEGFGLPALEAMRCDAPVIGSNRTSIPEVIGLEAALFDPTSTSSTCEKLQQALTDNAFRQQLREHAHIQAKKFSWKASAKRALEALQALHEQQKRTQSSMVQLPASSPKPRLAYLSPLPPEKSGIADYSAELLPELANYYQIDLITDLKEIADDQLANNFRQRSVSEFEACAHEYDRILYHFGNSPFHSHMFPLLAKYPGTVVLHDFFLSDILSYLENVTLGSRVFRQALYRSHGYKALLNLKLKGRKYAMWTYPCSLEVLQNARGVIVHSEYSLQLAEKFFQLTAQDRLVKIPLLRRLPKLPDRIAARKALGLPHQSFMVCSFGILGPAKLNDRLLNSWLSSGLARDERCRLVFVGDGQGSAIVQSLRKKIKTSGISDRINITGYASPETYRQYLDAADAAVQLRGHSRGETSAAVFDCLAHGLATVVNSNGSLAELPDSIVIKLADEFTDAELTAQLEWLYQNPDQRQAMGSRAVDYVREHLDPSHIARQYEEAIEAFTQTHPVANQQRLLSEIAALPVKPVPKDAELVQVAGAIGENMLRWGNKQILVDISVLAQQDAKSGVQRVVRNILKQWLEKVPESYRVEPVYRSEGIYRYARRFMGEFLYVGEFGLDDAPVEISSGDIFLGLDLDAGMDNMARGWLQHHARRGLAVYFVVYDILPLLKPDWFPKTTLLVFKGWLENIASLADGIVCISKTVASELGLWLEKHPVMRARPLNIGYFSLGADIENDVIAPENTLSKEESALLAKLADQTVFLMVGTVEPRKGHAQALDAFEGLWASGEDLTLVIVGKQGWSVEELAQRLQSHPEFNKRLIWLTHASDVLLQKLYGTGSVLLMASEGEGFGLPLVEAAQHSLPIIARDLPVFQEVSGDHAFYFNGMDGRALADAIKDWLRLYRQDNHPRPNGIKWMTWEESARQLQQVLLESQWVASCESSHLIQIRPT